MTYQKSGLTFHFTANIREDDHLRESFFSLADQIFHLNFRPWHSAGGWTGRYIPHALVLDGQIAANVSVNLMDFCLDGETCAFVQLGTVMTHPEFRGLGLSRFLMEQVLSLWRDRCDGIYLFANSSVLDFYPKFGFVPAQSWQASITPAWKGPLLPLQKLDLSLPEGISLLLEAYSRSNPFSAFTMEGNPGLLLFYATGPFRDCCYLLPDGETIAIGEQDGGDLCCHEILGPCPYPLEQVLTSLSGGKTSSIRLGFTPKLPAGQVAFTHSEEYLFLLPGKPVLPFHRAFVFPSISLA